MNLTRSALAPQLDHCATDIGEYTYGVPTVHAWYDRSARLTIGRYCSIGGGVDILLGGNHRTDWITTSPLPAFYGRTAGGLDLADCECGRGDVSIGNDVWIGQNATILSGVTIGDGAIIGACSVVTRDVPPYGVCVGNPGRVVRKRFADDTIERLLQLRWWDWDDERVAGMADVLLSGNVEALLQHRVGQSPGEGTEPARSARLGRDPAARQQVAAADLYLDLLIKCITNSIYRDPNQGEWLNRAYDAEARRQGADWPEVAHSMIGVLRLENLRDLASRVLRDAIPGDFIETGVWRGGACHLDAGRPQSLRGHDPQGLCGRFVPRPAPARRAALSGGRGPDHPYRGLPGRVASRCGGEFQVLRSIGRASRLRAGMVQGHPAGSAGTGLRDHPAGRRPLRVDDPGLERSLPEAQRRRFRDRRRLRQLAELPAGRAGLPCGATASTIRS